MELWYFNFGYRSVADGTAISLTCALILLFMGGIMIF